MPLHIVVCVKHTPSTIAVDVDSATGQPRTAGLVFAMNPFDEYAVEEAVRIKERNPGSTITALSLGPDADQAVLRDAISRGCDAAFLITGPEVLGSDSYATSRALAAAIRKISEQKPVHLALFGKNTNDGNSGVVGGMVAAWLDWPGVLSVKKIQAIDESAATLWRMMEDGIDVVKVGLPAAVGTVKEINEPRIPSLKGKMAAKKAVIAKWTAADIGLKPEEAGAAGSPSRLARSAPPPPRPAGLRIAGATASEKAEKLVTTLIERKLI
ncbi:MAG TPA: electron transfer flavoprotein subunit beta [Elusimicrobia bacterium]|nr:electron transfer flavoprotein subunit beta [Elusimicrobiota bacterium]HBT62216.1 electron transfer flavoprotein subunit beta [Elusimicrobiota bacterium]